VLDHVELHECNYNWKTFIEVYLEDYHVGPFHPGLGSFRHLRRPALGVRQELFGADRGRGQPPGQGGQPRVRALARGLLAYRNGEPPKHGAIWLTYYPHIMVEWYPHAAHRVHAAPHQPDQDAEHGGVLLPRRNRAFEREFVEAQQAAYMETCIEDDEIGERMDAGRKALLRAATTKSAPTRAPWKTACSTFTSGTAARWAQSADPHRLAPNTRRDSCSRLLLQ
jgi:choline monooxygenase